MTNYGRSLFYFGIYVLLTGLLLLFLPVQFLDILKLPAIPTGWARMIGLLVIIIGIYDMLNGYHNNRPLITASVYLRVFFFAGIGILFLLKEMPKEALPLGVIDLLGAAWTWLALRSRSAGS